ncbi:MAG: hypothetical protein IKF38_07020 [Clostridia bacterium]|nr:hypothetical protein [Clostridia bacterium]
MNKIKKGDIVGRKSYKKDIIFIVTKIITNQKEKIALLKGIYERIEADSKISDLEIIKKEEIQKNKKKLETKIENRINQNQKRTLQNEEDITNSNKRSRERIITGKILHLDAEKDIVKIIKYK